jgi:hypothetical protein
MLEDGADEVREGGLVQGVEVSDVHLIEA